MFKAIIHHINHKHIKSLLFEGQGYDYEFVGLTDIELNVTMNKPSLGANTIIPDDFRSKTKANLNKQNNKYNCVRLSITAALYPVDNHGTR